MAIGIHWEDIWQDAWQEVWQGVDEVPETPTGVSVLYKPAAYRVHEPAVYHVYDPEEYKIHEV